MKSCNGCRYRIGRGLTSLPTVCSVHDREYPPRDEVSPFDGSVSTRYSWRPTIDEERTTGRCGPDATLYQPTHWQWLKVALLGLVNR